MQDDNADGFAGKVTFPDGRASAEHFCGRV
jgi:hypothetical protein